MGLKEDAKRVVADVIGPVTAEKVDLLPDEDPEVFLDTVKNMIAQVLGEDLAKIKLQELYREHLGKEIF